MANQSEDIMGRLPDAQPAWPGPDESVSGSLASQWPWSSSSGRLRVVLYGTLLATLVALIPLHVHLHPTTPTFADVLILAITVLIELGIIEIAIRWISGYQRRLKLQAEALDRLATVARRTTNAVIISDSSRRIAWVNEGFTRVFGYTPEEVHGQSPGTLFQCEHTDPETVKAIREALSNGRGFVGEILNKRKDGRDFWISMDIQPIKDAQGDITGFMAVGSDISDQKRAAKAHAELAAELAGFFENSRDLLWIARLDGTLVRVNGTWSELLGQQPEQLVGKTLREFLHPDDVASSEAWIRRIAGGDNVDGLRTRCRAIDGTWRTCDWRASEHNGLLYGVGRDVSAQLRLEQSTHEQAERMELALSGGDIGTWDWDVPTGKLSVDDRWAAMIGERAETVGNSVDAWSSRVHPLDLERCLERLRRHFKGGESYQDVRFRMKHADGSWRWIKASGSVMSWSAEGEPIRMVGVHIDITESIHRQRERDEANQRVELALRAGQMGLWDWDLETGAFHFDQRWATTIGEWAEDLAPDAATLLSRIHDDDLQDVERSLQCYLDGASSSISVRCRMRHRDGSWRWVQLFGASTRLAGDEGGRLVGIQMDIHDQVQAQLELARREALLLSTLHMTGVGGWEYDLVNENLYWSDQVRAIHEVPEDYEPCVADGIDFYYGADREKVAQSFARLVENGESFDIECRFVTAKGRHRWVRSVGEPVHRDGQIVRVVGAFQDITEEREQRDAIEATNRVLEAAQSIARMGSWIFDRETRRVTWSKPLFEIYEQPIEKGAPTTEEILTNHYVPEDSRRLAAAIEAALENATPYKLTLERANPTNGIRFVTVDGVARVDETGKVVGLMGTARDVTAEFEREAELRDAHARAEVASQAKTDFLANMSHEIRTPMTSIIGYADLLAESGLSAEQQAEYASTIRRNGQHLITLINDVLDISKIEAGQMMVERIPVEPRELLESVLDLMRIQAEGKRLALDCQQAGHVPDRVLTDPTRLRQILVNLINNAIKFTDQGGVNISMDYKPQEQGGGELRFCIADTGIGMDEHEASHVFEAFTQADASTTRRFGGTGLGLNISKKLAELLGGDIRFESERGKGTTFYVTIRAERCDEAVDTASQRTGREERAAKPVGEHRDRPLDGLRVLLIEDGVDNARLIRLHLERSGARVCTAFDGKQGLARLMAEGPPPERLRDPLEYDVIVSDMQMPELDGYAVVQTLRDAGCELPIIALTAHSMAGDRQRCLAVGCDAYATKPINRQSLVSTILHAMARRQAA